MRLTGIAKGKRLATPRPGRKAPGTTAHDVPPNTSTADAAGHRRMPGRGGGHAAQKRLTPTERLLALTQHRDRDQ